MSLPTLPWGHESDRGLPYVPEACDTAEDTKTQGFCRPGGIGWLPARGLIIQALPFRPAAFEERPLEAGARLWTLAPDGGMGLVWFLSPADISQA